MGLDLIQNTFITFSLSHFCQFDIIIQGFLHGLKMAQIVFQIGLFAHQLLRAFGIVPQIGISRQGIQFIQTEKCIIIVKETSSAVPKTA